MNKNLHKLHLRAAELAFEQACVRHGVRFPQQHVVFNEYVEIFAYLIIFECARISDESDCTMTGQGSASAEEFKRHFEAK